MIIRWAMAASTAFRASWHQVFFGMTLEKEQQSNLLLHPFCFMEA
jgi:hypothetical protein